MVDIVKPPCNITIIHDFYTYPHLFFWDKFFSQCGLMCKKNEQNQDNSLYIHIIHI